MLLHDGLPPWEEVPDQAQDSVLALMQVVLKDSQDDCI